ncbi:MAG: hypothetical protein IJY65_05130 [Clostridia bacterium]|nr:hypothetical protein [Clostridia bacterium]
MIILSVWYVWVYLGVLVLFHAASAFLDGLPSRITSYVNIALHAVYIPVLLVAGAPIEEGVLLYMISVLSYTLFCFVKHELQRRGGKEDDEV